MIPKWLDPSAALETFRQSMSACPMRERSDAEEFRQARIEGDALAKESREARALAALEAHRKAGFSTAEKKRARVVQDCLERGISPKERRREMQREAYWKRRIRRLEIAKE